MKILLKCKKGFTLVEVLTVVVIIMVLIAVAVPSYNNARQQAKEVAFDATVRNLKQAAEMHLIDGGGDAIWAPGAGAVARDTIGGAHETWYSYLSEWPENPLETGDFVVEISGTAVMVSPGRDYE